MCLTGRRTVETREREREREREETRLKFYAVVVMLTLWHEVSREQVKARDINRTQIVEKLSTKE